MRALSFSPFRLISLAVFTFFTLLVLNMMPAPATAQDVAPGYWRDTCRNVDRDGSVINADRRTVDGRWRRQRSTCAPARAAPCPTAMACWYATTLPRPAMRPTMSMRRITIAFRPAHGAQLQQRRTVGNDLVAVCVKRDGYTNKARLDLGRCPAGPVYNDNGRLVCGDNTYGTRYGLPDGQWREPATIPRWMAAC